MIKSIITSAIIILAGLSGFAQKKIVVAKDGTGSFTTVQKAFDAVPYNNKKPVIIFVKNGIYYEKLLLDSTKSFVRLVGEDKYQTVLTYNDHTGKLSAKGDTINTFTSQTFMVRANDFSAENISFENNAGFNAGQAVTVHAYGNQLIFKNCRFLGFQDVLFTSNYLSNQYYENCYIEGTTDFIFGAATAWFEKCQIHSKKNSHVTAASTPQEKKYGYIFNDCILTGDSGLHGVSLGRPWRPYASVIYLNCYIGDHILGEGWNNWKKTENEKTARFAEFKSFGPGSDSRKRHKWTSQLSDQEAKEIQLKNVFPFWKAIRK